MVYGEMSRLAESSRLIQRIEYFCPFHAPFDRLCRSGRLHAAIAQLMGEEVCLFKEKINYKMAGGGGFEPHQDQQAGWSRYAPLFVTALVTIDRATEENGCLEMAEGERLTSLVGEEWRPLTESEMRDFALVPVPTEPGDVLFFDSYAPHGSKPNLTAEQRRILYLTYNAARHGDHHRRYFADKRANFPPDVERAPGVDYKFRV
jgi:ectoine hydroxylase-related dioxygenase (phytanoyl-CoA dioxygenase family)